MKSIKFHHIVYIGILLFLVYSLAGNVRLFLKARKNLDEAQMILETESTANKKLHDQLVEVGKQIYVERVARDTLGLAHENEVVFIIPPGDDVKKLSPRYLEQQKIGTSENSIPHWQEWAQLFL